MDAYYGKTVVALALIAGVENCELSMCSFGILKNLTQRSLGSQGAIVDAEAYANVFINWKMA